MRHAVNNSALSFNFHALKKSARKKEPGLQKTLDYDGGFSYTPSCPKSHVPVGVRRPSIW
jgi:hypothetical protein